MREKTSAIVLRESEQAREREKGRKLTQQHHLERRRQQFQCRLAEAVAEIKQQSNYIERDRGRKLPAIERERFIFPNIS